MDRQMITERVREYIDCNSFCSEYLFRNWDAFLDVLYEEGCHVAAIQWWDHCIRHYNNVSVGSGGYIDPDDPEYMYAETFLYEDGMQALTLEELKTHIAETREHGLILGDKYYSNDLVPSFYLQEEEN